MQRITLPLLYSLFLTNLLNLLLITSAGDSLLYTIISNVTTSNSTYKSNLGDLVSFLHEKASAEGYSEQTFGVPPDQVSGVVLCRGDVYDPDCTGCIDRAYGYVTNNGSSNSIPIEAVIWYDFCLFQYSNQPISPTDNSPRFFMWNTLNSTNQIFDGWDQSNEAMISIINSTLLAVLKDASHQAAFNSSKRFGSAETIDNYTPQIFGLSQCIPSFSNDMCNVCLQDLINELLASYHGRQSGRLVGVKCNLRYETFRFFYGIIDVRVNPLTEILPPPPSVQPVSESSKGRRSRLLGIVISVTVVLLILGCIIGIIFRKLRSAENEISQEEKALAFSDATLDLMNGEGSADVPLFHFNQLVDATSNFSLDNKLGQGGFGPVYKGVLQGGLEIAIKRLSARSGQGLTEFRNEIQVIGKLQHRNLVRLVGWCVQGQEKLLVYEFMPNKSLDFFIFDETRAALLNWERPAKGIRVSSDMETLSTFSDMHGIDGKRGGFSN
ncbi:cysteine-rich RECEPTOR-like kinase [Rhynchospora pubera]|uniref:non-specific serine/threonine protein kinase n=1 Tax=Rhynchospora pubera TaxID=906938 RepID=A0AAV8D2T5_9POAL|nr:cysteine-rich RECEPTOR-like kinase [Rhynchospora pubera]